MAGDQHFDGRRRPDQPLRGIRRGRPRRRAREVRSAQPAGTAAGKRGKPSGRALPGATSRQATGTPWRRSWPTTFPATIAVGWWARESDMVETPRSRTCGRSPTCRIHERDVDRHRDPRGAPCPHACPLLGPRSRARGISSESCSASVEINADERIVGGRLVRPRRLRRRHRGARRPVPRRRSGRPRAHVVGHRGCFRRAQPARTPSDDTGLGEHRPPPGGSVRAGEVDRIHPCRVGPRRQTSASTSRPCIG